MYSASVHVKTNAPPHTFVNNGVDDDDDDNNDDDDENVCQLPPFLLLSWRELSVGSLSLSL